MIRKPNQTTFISFHASCQQGLVPLLYDFIFHPICFGVTSRNRMERTVVDTIPAHIIVTAREQVGTHEDAQGCALLCMRLNIFRNTCFEIHGID